MGLLFGEERDQTVIPVTPQPEPPGFDTGVRTPGKAFLRRVSNPSREQFRKSNFWKACLPDLRQAYSEICAYSACWVPMEGSVDHFWPISVRPDRAYEWDNYRLAFQKLNSYKGNSTDVLDPFHIREGWFVLNFNNFFVEPSTGLTVDIEAAVQKTISVLRLNVDDCLVQMRFNVVKDYAKGDVTFDFMVRRYPFIAIEIQRQGLEEKIRTYFK